LHIGNNRFGGSIPAVAVSLKRFNAENNQFSGEIPGNLGNGMPQLLALNLSGNQISGSIPWSFSRLSYLEQMDVSRNLLTGEIPPELGTIPALNVLDLSSNELSGSIPSALAKLELSSLNLSSNQLSGRVPAGLAIAAYDRSFVGNPNLCTAPATSGDLAGVRPCTCSGGCSGGVSPALRSGLLATGAVLLLIFGTAFAFFVVHDVRARRRLAKKTDDWKMTPFQALDFKDMAIPHGLKEESLVGHGGSGRVYRVTYTNRYNGSTGVVAVKQIQSSGPLDKKLEREFESEAGILGNVRHKNIIKLLCCLSGAESKLLVYDYMDNGSLDMWLHGRALRAGHAMVRIRSLGRAPLDWPTRLGVAIGAAQGLCYMHHECSPPIVHRDIKTSNILLDSEFRAKVADFGLARLLVQAGAPETMSVISGSVGYIAPECAYYTRRVNEKMDVYSFGVVLLELTTGKEAADGGEHGCLAEWARHHYRSGASITDTIDKCIKYAGCHGEIETVFRLGVTCTGNSPSSRPTMKDVLQMLLKCSEQTHRKSETGHSPEYEAAPLLLSQ